MEKVMYLVWLEQDRTREEVAERLLGPVREELMALAPRGLSMDVWNSGPPSRRCSVGR
jgi:hypothetical protein